MHEHIIPALIFLFILSFERVNAQNIIQTDRPDQTETPFTVPAGYFQAESGFTYEKISKDFTSITHPSVLWKYGVSKNFEFRLITELVSEKNNIKTVTGFALVLVGFKINIVEEKGILPMTSFIGHITIPKLASPDFKVNYYAPSFRFTMQNTLSNHISLGYNLGAEWDGESPKPTFIYTVTAGFSLTDKIGAYTEIYGFAPQKSTADHRFDAGFTYLINHNVMIDLSGGFGITDNAPRNYGAIGFSYRFNTKQVLKN